MAQTRTRLLGRQYDAYDNDIGSLEDAFRVYNTRHAEFVNHLAEIEAPLLESVVRVITDIIFPPTASEQVQATYYSQGETLFNKATTIAQLAVKLKSKKADAWLKEIGQQVEQNILAIQWHTPVNETLILLTALKDSPSAFLQLSNDSTTKEYIAELNAAKRDYPKEIDAANGVEKINQYFSKIDVIHIKFTNDAEGFTSRIKEIDAERKVRSWWRRLWFFFTGDTGQVKKQELLHRGIVVKTLIENVELLKSGKSDVENNYKKYQDELARQELDSLKNKLLDTPELLLGADLQKLAGIYKETQDKELVTDLAAKLAEKIKNNIDALDVAVTADQAAEALKIQFAFLNQFKAEGHDLLNTRKQAIQLIKDKLAGFKQCDDALAFITSLEKTNVTMLDAELPALVDQCKAEYTAWKLLTDKNTLSLLDGELQVRAGVSVEKQIRAIQQATMTTLCSNQAAIQEAGKKFVATLTSHTSSNLLASNSIGVITTTRAQQQVTFFVLAAEAHNEESRAKNRALGQQQEGQILPADSRDEAYTLLENSVKAISIAITEKVSQFENMRNDVAGSYIVQLSAIDFAKFNPLLTETITTRKEQYVSWVLLRKQWAKLLSNNEQGTEPLNEEEVTKLVIATLWLSGDASINVSDNPNSLISMIFAAYDQKKPYLQEELDNYLTDLVKQLNRDCDLLSESINPAAVPYIKNRFAMFNYQNIRYCANLLEHRATIIGYITSQLNSINEPIALETYLENLAMVWPKEDPALEQTIQFAKNRIILPMQNNFKRSYDFFRAENQAQLNFLRTGDVSLWDKIAMNLGVRDKLQPENLAWWGQEFISTYVNGIKQKASNAINAAKQVGNEEKEKTAKIMQKYLLESVKNEVQSIAEPLTADLIRITDLAKQKAHAKLDQVFGFTTEITPVDMNLFVLRYLAIANYRQEFGDDIILDEAGKEFVRVFQQSAQQEGGFATQLVAQLSVDALAAMYATWQDDPSVDLIDVAIQQMDLEDDLATGPLNIVGVVGTGKEQNKKIILPKYLLLSMVIVQIQARIEALLKGDALDDNQLKQLSEWISFVVPKLASHEQDIKQLEEAVAGTKLRNVLQNLLKDKFNLTHAKNSYADLIEQRSPVELIKDKLLGVTNLPKAELGILDKLKEKLIAKNPGVKEYDPQNVKNMHDDIASIKERIDYLENNPKFSEAEEFRSEQLHGLGVILKDLQDKVEKAEKFECLHAALEKNNLKDFLFAKQAGNILKTLGSEDEQYFLQLRHAIYFADLLQDASFNNTLQKVEIDLQNTDIGIITILKELPENIISELPKEQADIIRELQYRFADRFAKLMTKLLGRKNVKTFTSDLEEENSVQFPGTPGTPKPNSKAVARDSAVEEKLKTVLKGIKEPCEHNNALFHQFMDLLAPAAKAGNTNVSYLYALHGSSEPKAVSPATSYGSGSGRFFPAKKPDSDNGAPQREKTWAGSTQHENNKKTTTTYNIVGQPPVTLYVLGTDKMKDPTSKVLTSKVPASTYVTPAVGIPGRHSKNKGW